MALSYERQFQLTVILLLVVLGLIALGFAGVVSEATVRGILVPASYLAIGIGLVWWFYQRFLRA